MPLALDDEVLETKKQQSACAIKPKKVKKTTNQIPEAKYSIFDSMVDAIESKLGDNCWLGGQQPSKEDAEQFVSLG